VKRLGGRGSARMVLTRGGRGRSAVASVVALSLMTGLLGVSPVQAEAGPRHHFKDEKPVKGHSLKVRPRKSGSDDLTTKGLAAPAWPKPGTVDADVTAKGKWGQAGGLPVWVASPQGQANTRSRGAQRPAADPAKRVRVQVLDRGIGARAGVQGVMLAVSRTDAAAPGQLTVGLNYSGFASSFGGGLGSRLRLVQYPACVLTTPERLECRTAMPVATGHDDVHKTLTAQVQAAPSTNAGTQTPSASPPPSSSASPRNRPISEALNKSKVPVADATVLAAEAGTAGEGGDYKATKLTPSSTWSVGPNTGEFTWSYPMRVPPVPSGLSPKVEIGYSSGSVDGRTSNSNSQSSWVGEGFDLWPGFIERHYKSCEDDGAPKDEWGNSPGDQCWGYDNATLSWNGHGGELIPTSDGKWRLRNDDGTRIEKFTGTESDTNNGDNNNEYWKITTTDGTQYFFGKHRLRGWSSGKAETNSTWTVPVFGDDSNEPCHDDSFAKSSCSQAWRWNLDYVVDTDGNAIVYYYSKETNYYGRNLKPADEVAYTRGGVLNRIEYGLRSDDLWANAPARVMFTSKERCLDTVDNCDESKIDSNRNLWPDTPYDLNCKSGTECKDFHGSSSPTFWTRKRLTSVMTQVVKPDGTWLDVDEWKLFHKWGTADYDRALLPLWIQHTGRAGSTPIELPKTTFDYEERDNRVRGGDTGHFMRYRLDYVADEIGSETSVAYSTAQCAADNLPQPETNTKRCFPVYWAHDGDLKPSLDWFHKYVVTHVIARDRTGHTPDMVTKYVYDEDGGAAWHFDDDQGLTKEKYKTWSQWRGYGRVSVLTGSDLTGEMSAQTDHYYLRGMDGDRTSATDKSKTRTAYVTDGNGGAVADENPYAGHELRTVQFDKPGGKIVNWKQNLPRKFQTASVARDWGTLTANIAVTEYGRTFTPIGAGTWRQAEIRTEHDPATGRVTWESDNGGPGGGDDRCTRKTYADDTDAWMLSYVSHEEVTRGGCTASGLDRTKDVLSDTRTYYDGSASAPKSSFGSISRGRVTYIERLVSHAKSDGSDPTYQKVSAVTGFDTYGRGTSTSDAAGHVTTTAYVQTPATNGLTTKTTITEPSVTHDGTTYQLSSTTTLDTAWGLPIVKVDSNTTGGTTQQLALTDIYYDALGRTIKVWLPDRSRKDGQSDSMEFTYQVDESKPVAVGTRKVTNTGALDTPTYEIYDGFLRTRQTQAPGINGGRIITDTMYDGRGQVAWTYNGYYNDQAAPNPALFGPDMQGLVHSQTRFSYDGAGRKTREALLGGAGDNPEVSATAYSYGSDANGDWTNVTPPAGGTPTTTYTNARGKAVELREYNAAAPAGDDYITTSYSYDPADRVTRITGPGGKTWSYAYDTRGRKVTTVDPDKGTTSVSYNDLDQITSTTDGRGNAGKLFHEYDELGRKLRTYAATPNGDKGDLIALWGYDSVKPGQLTFASRKAAGADGNLYEYKFRTDSYDALNRATRTSVIIPEGAEGDGLDGTYQFNTAFNPDGTVASTSMPAAGGLPAEVVTQGYDALKQPTTLSGLSPYVTGTGYSTIGEVRSYVLSSGGKNINVGFDYDPATRRLARNTVSREGVDGYDRDATYTYDEAGNVKQVTDVTGHANTGGVTTDTQCLRYDHQQRLVDGWTTASTECPDSPTTSAGPAPYRVHYAYSPDGNRTTEQDYDTTDQVATRNYRYQGEEGVDASVRGHMLGRVDQTGTSPLTGPPSTETYTYDATGSAIRRQVGDRIQTFTWGPDETLTRITDAGAADGTDKGTTTQVYAPDGSRLLRRDPAGTTLYLPGMELSRTGSTTSAVRYYGHAGQTIATRTATGLTFLLGDHQNTSQLAIAGNDLSKISRRRYTPFGQTRGSTSGVPWLSTMDKGFVGGTEDPTGLTNLGAREYAPDTGRFISIDPIFDESDPQSWNGYAYSDNNPVTLSDPDGQHPCHFDPSECSDGGSHGGHEPGEHHGYPSDKHVNTPRSVGNTETVVVPKHVNLDKFRERFWYYYRANGFSQYQPKSFEAQATTDMQMALLACRETTTCARSTFYSMLLKNWVDANGGMQMLFSSNGGFRLRGRARVREAIEAQRCNSFVSGTPVRMADGSNRPIEKIRPGDKVLATDPKTGKTRAQKVVASFAGTDYDHLVEIRIQAGRKHDHGGVIIATEHHRFWDPSRRRWIRADQLNPGSTLRTPAGASARVTSLAVRAGHPQVRDLTVANVHTFYAIAGTAPVLVHNESCGRLSDPLPNGMNKKIVEAYDKVKAGELTPHDIYQGREYPWWRGAEEYRVPGRPESDRILVKTLPGGIKVYGWTTTHYDRIQRFSAPHFPDSGW
jgi:RHS repeat-associated protein